MFNLYFIKVSLLTINLVRLLATKAIFIYRDGLLKRLGVHFNLIIRFYAEKNPSNLSPDNTGVGKPEVPALVTK